MSALSQLILFILRVFQLILLARVLLTWFPNVDRNNPIIRLIHDVTEPVLRPIRDMLPPSGGIDFSPLVVFLVLYVLASILPAILR